MLVLNGYFDNSSRFISETAVSLPRNKAIKIIIEDENDKAKQRQERIIAWRVFSKAIRDSDEVLEGEPERIRFRTPEEIDAL